MRKLLLPIAATAVILVSGEVGAHAATVGACVHVKIGSRNVCLIAGRPCQPRYEKQYRRHGFECRRNTAGEYRLWEGPPRGLPPAV